MHLRFSSLLLLGLLGLEFGLLLRLALLLAVFLALVIGTGRGGLGLAVTT